MPTGRAGQFNIQGITNPGAYIINNLPQPYATGVPTNIEGMVGVGSWGPVNSVIIGTNNADCAAKLGTPQVRFADIATHVAAACQMGGAINFRWVRVTDGSDTAATATVQSTAGTAVARFTGIAGNGISISFANTGRVGAFAAIVQGPAGLPERFDNIFSGLQSVTVAAGTGYTSVPTAVVTAPQIVGGSQATVQPTLTSLASPTVTAPGAGYVVGEKIPLPNGMVLTVATVTSGAVATVTVTTPATLTSGSTPANPVTQTTTTTLANGSTGAGTGATFTLTYGLGSPVFSSGSGYYLAQGNPLSITLTGGGGTGGTYTPVISFWAALANAINNGTPTRGRSQNIVFTAGSSTASPTIGVPVVLAGGTDGANGVGTLQLVGVDGAANARTGMYALRGTGIDAFELCDCTDNAPWGAMLAFAIQESSYAVAVAPVSTSIASTVSIRQGAGIDDPQFKLISGDWPTFYDSYYGARLVSPAAIALGLFGNLSPEQGTINKPLPPVISTQTSTYGIYTSDGDEQVAETGGIDVIGRSDALNEVYFTFLTGRNTSSNSAANGDEYTRLTNFLIKTFENIGKSFVGRLQSRKPDDPTRTDALQTFDSECQDLASPSSGSGGYGMIDAFLNICDLTNNSSLSIGKGYLFLTCRVDYLNVVRYFVVNLFGGNGVSVTVSNTNGVPSV